MDVASFPRARFLWASPSCVHHSQARANKMFAQGAHLFSDPDFDEEGFAMGERSRVTALCPLRYSAHHFPELVVVENVIQFAQWGPTDPKGRPDGSTFRWWLNEWRTLGYDYECLFLNSQFFPPCPQSRDRMYVVFWRRGNTPPNLDYRPKAYCDSHRCGGVVVEAYQAWKPRTKSWPLPRWGKYGAQYTYKCSACHTNVVPAAWPAYSCIDWSNLGPAIGDRSALGMKPLADSTMERIRRGLIKFRGGPPILIPAKASWGVDRSVVQPMATQTTQQDKALVSAFLTKNYGGIGEAGYRAIPITGPTGAMTTSDSHGLVSGGVIDPTMTHSPSRFAANRSRRASEPTFTVTAGGSQALATEAMVVNTGQAGSARHKAGNRTRRPEEPLFTLTAGRQDQGIATNGVIVAAAGNTFDRAAEGGYVRATDLRGPMFTQHTSQAFGFAHMPFIAEMRGGGSKESGQHAVTDPAHAVTAGGLHHALASVGSMFSKINGGPGDTAWHSTHDPLNTVTAADTHGLVILPWIEQFRSDPAAITEQLATVMTHLRHAVASIEPDERPITREDLERVRFRMLAPDPELRFAMAFEAGYILLGTATQMTSGLGNAVTPPVASWITERCLATLSADPERMVA